MDKSRKAASGEIAGKEIPAPGSDAGRRKAGCDSRLLLMTLVAAGAGFTTAAKAAETESGSFSRGASRTATGGAACLSAAGDADASACRTVQTAVRDSGTGNSAYVQIGGAGDGTDNARIGGSPTGTWALDNIAIGAGAAADTGFIGSTVPIYGSGAIAIGYGAQAVDRGWPTSTAQYAIALGDLSVAYGRGAVAFGAAARATAGGTLAAGMVSNAGAVGAVALGAYASAQADSSVALGIRSVADVANTVSVGAAGSERQIVNVKAGTRGTDAVNLAQLTAVGEQVTKNTADIATLHTTIGTISGSVANAVHYDSAARDRLTLGGSTAAAKVQLTNLQDAELTAISTDAVTGAQLWDTNRQVADLDQAVRNQRTGGSSGLSINTTAGPATATGSEAVALGGDALASGAHSVAIGGGSIADQADTVSVGAPRSERRIVNLADGEVPTDAVNLRQYQSGIRDVSRYAFSGIAAATALAMIPDADANRNFAIGVAVANYKGYQAAAVSASARLTQNLKARVGAGVSMAGTAVGAGMAYQW